MRFHSVARTACSALVRPAIMGAGMSALSVWLSFGSYGTRATAGEAGLPREFNV
nr:MAG TPA: hypothetical protein [Caudoviricetes sp.]